MSNKHLSTVSLSNILAIDYYLVTSIREKGVLFIRVWCVCVWIWKMASSSKRGVFHLENVSLFLSELFATAILVFFSCSSCIKWNINSQPDSLQIFLSIGFAVLISIQAWVQFKFSNGIQQNFEHRLLCKFFDNFFYSSFSQLDLVAFLGLILIHVLHLPP